MRRGKKTRLTALLMALFMLTSGITVSATGTSEDVSSDTDNTEAAPAASEGNYITDEDFSNEMIEKNYTVVM